MNLATGVALATVLLVSGAAGLPFSDEAGQFEADFPGEPVLEKKETRNGATQTPPDEPPLSPSAQAAAQSLQAVSSCVEALVASKRECLKVNDIFKDCPDCPEMVIAPTPTGRITMGSPESEKGRQKDEG